MGCNCKNEITNFLGGDISNPTTFLNCGEADGTYNNPIATGITQCVAIDNVLRVLDTYYISGTVKNSGKIVFERTVTGDTCCTTTDTSGGYWSATTTGHIANSGLTTINVGVGTNTPREALDVTGGVAVSASLSATTVDLTQTSAGSLKLPYHGTITAKNSGGVARTILYNIGDTVVQLGSTSSVNTMLVGINTEVQGTGFVLMDSPDIRLGDSVSDHVTATGNVNISGNTNIIGTLSANTVSGDTVVVGPAATSYTLPTVRGTNRYVLQTDAAGGTAWVSTADTNTSYFVERFQVYDTARGSGTYFYPKPMTDTGRMAEVNVDYGSDTISTDTKIARATVLKSAYFVVPSTCTLEKIVGWGEFASSNTIRIDVCKFTLTDDETGTLAPTSIGSVSYAGGSDIQNTKSFASTGIGAELSQGDVIMPMVKATDLSSGSHELSAFFTLEFKYVL